MAHPVPPSPVPDGTVLIDGLCVLCSDSFRFAARRDKRGLFTFAPVQGAWGRRATAVLGIDPDNPDTFAVVLDGRPLFRSSGAIAVLSRLPGWEWTRFLSAIPAPVRDWLYDRVVCNRYALFGRRETCMVPDAALRARMVVDDARDAAP